VNFEMFTLPDEMFKQSGKTIRLTFGPVIKNDQIRKGRPIEVAAKIRSFLYKLKENPSVEYES